MTREQQQDALDRCAIILENHGALRAKLVALATLKNAPLAALATAMLRTDVRGHRSIILAIGHGMDMPRDWTVDEIVATAKQVDRWIRDGAFVDEEPSTVATA